MPVVASFLISEFLVFGREAGLPMAFLALLRPPVLQAVPGEILPLADEIHPAVAPPNPRLQR